MSNIVRKIDNLFTSRDMSHKNRRSFYV